MICFHLGHLIQDQEDYAPTWKKKTGQTSLGVLHAVLVTTLKEGCDSVGNGAKEIHQDDAWDGAFQL